MTNTFHHLSSIQQLQLLVRWMTMAFCVAWEVLMLRPTESLLHVTTSSYDEVSSLWTPTLSYLSCSHHASVFMWLTLPLSCYLYLVFSLFGNPIFTSSLSFWCYIRMPLMLLMFHFGLMFSLSCFFPLLVVGSITTCISHQNCISWRLFNTWSVDFTLWCKSVPLV